MTTCPVFDRTATFGSVTMKKMKSWYIGPVIGASVAGQGVPVMPLRTNAKTMKAKLAITLGKTYRQEGSLAWGYLTPPDDVRSEHVKLTQRKRRPAP